ncbi:hypothetical protein ACFLSU_05760 [Bacteroidota bacterium]
MKKFTILLIFTTVFTMTAQEKLPYYEIPEAPKEFTAGTIAGRMIDGLGFRYYWATENLRDKDLSFKPNVEARSSAETIDHILELSQVILNGALKVVNGAKQPKMTFSEKRKKTLENLLQASEILKESQDVSDHKMIFEKKEIPFWNMLNGPIADALWHTGQIVSFRRSSGNPFPKGVNVLAGKKRNL